MLRISPMESPDGALILRLEGRVIGPWVEELRRSCEEVLATGGRLSIDLSNVSFVDRNGVELLRSLKNRDMALLTCSPFVREQLKA